MVTPAIACIGVIGKHDQPLHVALFPPDKRDNLEFQFILNTSLDIFEARIPGKAADHDFGLLQALDEHLAMYGWLTNTGVKFVVVVDMDGRPARDDDDAAGGDGAGPVGDGGASALLGIRDSDLKPAFRALHRAYIRLLRNPFYDPDAHTPRGAPQRLSEMQISSPIFIQEVNRIGEAWYPGIQSI